MWPILIACTGLLITALCCRLLDLQQENRRLTTVMRLYRDHLDAVCHRQGITAADAPLDRSPGQALDRSPGQAPIRQASASQPGMANNPMGVLATRRPSVLRHRPRGHLSTENTTAEEWSRGIDHMLRTTARWQRSQQREVS